MFFVVVLHDLLSCITFLEIAEFLSSDPSKLCTGHKWMLMQSRRLSSVTQQILIKCEDSDVGKNVDFFSYKPMKFLLMGPEMILMSCLYKVNFFSLK